MTIRSKVPTLLLTRPEAQSRRFAQELSDLIVDRQFRTQIAPLFKIDAVDIVVDDDARAHVFTSENAIRLLPLGFAPGGRQAYCVGDRTAKAAQAAGYKAISAGGNVTDLLKLLQSVESSGFLYLSGAHLASEVLMTLPNLERRIIYHQTDLPPDLEVQAILAGDGVVVLPVFSPRTARRFCVNYPQVKADLKIVAISQAVADCFKLGAAAKITIAARPDGANMKAAVKALI